ncbi:MAG: hypothetical protein ACRDTH_09220 [Pseudonocardiaceae bacterium]
MINIQQLPQRDFRMSESGHALLAALCEHADPVEKVTILPAGMALGATEQLPEAERHLYSESYLTDQLTVRLGGRAAELLVFGEGSTGAANDLVSATQLATRMVSEFGLSPALGPVGYQPARSPFLPDAISQIPRGPYSEQTQRQVDQEVARLLREAEDRAVTVLTRHRAALDRLAGVLMEQETVDGSAVLNSLRDEQPTPEPTMNERALTSPHRRSTPDLLRQAAETLRQAARYAKPGPWQGGDPDLIGGALEQDRSTLEHLAAPTPLPAIRRTQAVGEPAFPGLRDSLEVFEDALQPTHPRVPANARWIELVSPLIAEPLATLLHSLAQRLEETIQTGGSADDEPYRSAVAVAKVVVGATAE